MRTKEQQERIDSNLKLIKGKLFEVLNASPFTFEMPEGLFGCLLIGKVRVDIRPPRSYMGRFDAGKENWTLDISEATVFERTRQVRIKVGDKGVGPISFNEAALLKIIKEKQDLIEGTLAKQLRVEKDIAEIHNSVQGALSLGFSYGVAASESMQGTYKLTLSLPLSSKEKIIEVLKKISSL